MIWSWLTVIALSMTPALVAGRTAAVAAGLAFGFDRYLLIAVISVSSFIGGLLTLWLAEASARLPRLKRLLQRLHSERAIKWCEQWGPWGGLIMGVAFIGPIPILISLKWMLVDTRRIVAPLALSSVAFTWVYYVLLSRGALQASQLEELWNLLGAL